MSHPPLGPYDLEKILGKGGMGTVYLGVNRDTGQQVAVKVLSPGYSADAGFRERFEAEIRSLEKLKHPNIVELYGYGEEAGTLFYAMELVTGPSLQQELRAGRRFHWREVTQLGIDICAALKQAHVHGIVHRDLKPANLLLADDDVVKLSDFGIAKLFGNTQITVEGGVVGTADYMSPEQAEGIGATARSDLYSLGGVLYCLLAGRPPFQGKSIPEVIHKLRYNEPIPLRRLADDVPEELDQVIAQLLCKEPQDRVPTARALSNRLKAIQHALSIHETGVLQIDASEGITRDVQPKVSAAEFAELETAIEPPHGNGSAGGARGNPSPTAAVKARVRDADHPAKSDTHYTSVDAEHRRRHLITDEAPSESVWTKIGVVVCLLALMGVLFSVVWQLRKPPTADQLYAKIEAAVNSDSDQLIHVEETVLSFIARFPEDERYQPVSEIRDDIELQRLERQLEVTARLRNAARSLAPVEQATVDAIRQETLNPETAARSFEAIIRVFETDPDATEREQKCIRLAKRHLTQLRTRFQRNAETAVDAIEARLNAAELLLETDPAEARQMLQGIVHLYRNKPWADEVVAKAQEILKAGS